MNKSDFAEVEVKPICKIGSGDVRYGDSVFVSPERIVETINHYLKFGTWSWASESGFNYFLPKTIVSFYIHFDTRCYDGREVYGIMEKCKAMVSDIKISCGDPCEN